MRPLLMLGLVVVVSVSIAACGKVHRPLGWGEGPDQSVTLGDGGVDLAGIDSAVVPGVDMVDPCAICSINATCDKTSGTATCTCKTGFTGDGKTCNDIDECALAAADCDTNATCGNTLGGFNCTCKPGFRPDPPGSAGKAGQCKQNWLHQTITDELPDGGGAPLDMGTSEPATVAGSKGAADGNVVGLGGKLYLFPGTVSDCNNPGNGPDRAWVRVYDPATGKLTTANKDWPTANQCYSSTDYYSVGQAREADSSIYFINPSYAVRFEASSKQYKDASSSWNGSAISGGNGVYNRGFGRVGDSLYWFGGYSGSAKIATTTTVTMAPSAMANPTSAASLPIEMGNPFGISTMDSVYLVYGDKDGTPAINDRIIKYTAGTNTFSPGNLTEYSASTNLIASPPNKVNLSNLKGSGGLKISVSYKGKLWFISEEWNGSNNTLVLRNYDPVSNMWSPGVDAPVEIGTQAQSVRLTTTGGATPKLWMVGKSTGALEIYQYNE